MSFKFQKAGSGSYIECEPGGLIIQTEQDILELIAVCGEYETNNIMFYEENLSPAFFDLKTKLAGTLFQKFANYHVRGAAVISFGGIESERFKELVFECNRGQLFRFFEKKATAAAWLTGQGRRW